MSIAKQMILDSISDYLSHEYIVCRICGGPCTTSVSPPFVCQNGCAVFQGIDNCEDEEDADGIADG